MLPLLFPPTLQRRHLQRLYPYTAMERAFAEIQLLERSPHCLTPLPREVSAALCQNLNYDVSIS